MEQPDFKQIAAQLRQPSGKEGIETAERMSINNGNMIAKCIDLLTLKDKDYVLEIGPGGGSHVPYLLAKAQDITYMGADISEAMVTLAIENNATLAKGGKVTFQQVALKEGYAPLPFVANCFNVLFTVNTIYFWDNAMAQAKELYRVLQTGGQLALCFATEAFMSSLPFTQYGFNLYSEEKAITLLEHAGFSTGIVHTTKEVVLNNSGQELEREFIVLLARK